MGQRQLLVLGNLKGAAMAALDVARRDTGYDALLQPKADDAIAALDAGEYRALLVDLTTPGAARFCHEARARRALFNVPLIALSPKLTDLAFSNALRWGADDVVELGAADPLAARLEHIPEATAPITEATRGEAVIADPERSRCDVLGRVLANAGFNVKYATDAVTTRFYLSKANISLFVLNTDLGEPAELIGHARHAGNNADWVVTTKTLNVDGVRSKLKGLDDVMVMSSHGPPENVLFALNLLRPSQEMQRRAEVRALYGAIVLFRPVGLDRDEFGFTYSVSSRGLYLRTLLEPPSERLWLEMSPPNIPRRVKLLAEVAWARTFGQAGAETAPPGFGVRILDGLGDDLEMWHQGFRSLDIRAPAGGVPEVATSSSFRVPMPSNPPPRVSRAPGTSGSLTSRSSQLPSATSSSRTSAYPRTSLVGRPSLPGRRPVSLSRVPAQSAEKAPPGERPSVTVPSSTWRASSEFGAATTTAPDGGSSQEAVLRAIRASLPPESLAKVNARVSRLPTPTATISAKEQLREASADELAETQLPTSERMADPVPAPDEPPQEAPRAAAERAAPVLQTPPLRTTDAPPEPRSSQVESNAPIDYDDVDIPSRPARTVIGIGDLSLMPLAKSDESPEAPPVSLDALDQLVEEAGGGATEHGETDQQSDGSQHSELDEKSQQAAERLEAEHAQTAVSPEPTPAAADTGSPEPPANTVVDTESPVGAPEVAASTAPAELPDADLVSIPPKAAEPRPIPPTSPPSHRKRQSSSTELHASLPAVQPPKRSTSGLWRSGIIAALLTMGVLLLGPRIYKQLKSATPESSSEPAAETRPSLATPAQATLGDVPSGAKPTRTAPAAPTQPPELPEPRKTVEVAKPREAIEQNPTKQEPAEEATTPPSAGPSEASAGDPPTPSAPASPDPSTLAARDAYIFVRSSLDAKVYVHGVDVGRTNTWLRSRCGFRFIRLGSAPGKWLSEGKPSKLRCRASNELELQPSR